MKKRIALIVSIMLVVIMSLSVFVACGKSSDKFSKFIKTAPNRGHDVVVSSAAKTSENISIVTADSTKNALVYKDVTEVDNPKYMLFDVKNNKEAVAWTLNEIMYNNILNVWYYLDKAVVTGNAVKVIDYEGTAVATIENVFNLSPVMEYVAVAPNQTLLRNNSTFDCYLFEDGKFLSEKTAGVNDLPSSELEHFVSEKYTVVMKNHSLLICDRASFDLIKVINLANYSSSVCDVLSVNMIDNGNIIFQTIEYLADDEKKYDVSINLDGKIFKINLSTYVVNIEKEKIKEIEFDFLLTKIENKNTLGVDYNSNYPNYSFACKIVDKAVLSSTSLVAFDNNLKVKFVGDDAIFGGISKLSQVGDVLWCVESDSKTLIVDKDGKVVNEYSGTKAQMGVSSTLWNVGFRMSSSNAVVKFDQTVLFEGAVNGKQVVVKNGASTIYSESLIVGETSEIHHFWTDNGGKVIDLDANGATMTDSNSYLYAIQSSDSATVKFYSVLSGSEFKSFEAANIETDQLKDGSILIYEKSGTVTIFSSVEIIFNLEG